MPATSRSFPAKLKRKLKRKLWLLDQYVQSRKHADDYAEPLKQLKSFCLFIGYPRSGSSLSGALIDAHPDAVMAHELDTLKCIRYHFSIQQIYWVVIQKAKHFTEVKGNRYSGYSYAVANQWQGRHRSLQVLGDKFGDRTIEAIVKWPEALDKLERDLTVPLKFIHVIRNPFDNISTIHKKTYGIRGTMEAAIDWYFSLADACQKIREQYGPERVYDLYLENLIADPRQQLTDLVTWLDLEPEPSYLDDCASIVFSKPRKTRGEVEWTPERIDRVRERIDRYDFLRAMNYDSPVTEPQPA